MGGFLCFSKYEHVTLCPDSKMRVRTTADGAPGGAWGSRGGTSCAMATDQSTSGEPANMIKHQRALVSAVAPGLRLLHLLLLCDSGSSHSVSTIRPPPPPPSLRSSPSLRSLPSPLISITSSSFLYLLVTFHNGSLPSALRLSIVVQPEAGGGGTQSATR